MRQNGSRRTRFNDYNFLSPRQKPKDEKILEDHLMANTLGKRYICDTCGTEVLCNKAGNGALECCDAEMKLKEAKALPSSD